MNTAEVLTQWIGTGTSEDDAYRPSITTDHPTIAKYEDTTGQPSENLTPNPNTFSCRIECDDATLAAIEADNNYYVISSDVIPEDII